MGYYNKEIILLFYLVGLLFFVFPKQFKYSMLIGGFAALSLYMLVGLNSWPFAESYAVKTLSGTLTENNYSYEYVHAMPDVAFYITPQDVVVEDKFTPGIRLDTDYFKSKNVKVAAFYIASEQEGIRNLLKYCEDSSQVVVNGYTIGAVCKFRGDYGVVA